MGLREAACLSVFIAALFVGCRGQGVFSANATALGQNITIRITDSTGSATFQCQLDNQPFVSCADGFVYTNVAPGNHNVTVRGTTQDGQVGELTLELSVSDSPPFMVTAVASPLGTSITVTIDANQDATFECQLDDSNFVPCISGFQYSGVSAGPHTIRVRATGTETGQVVVTNAGTVEIEVLAVDVLGITGTQDITAQTFTYNFMTSENFTVQCSIDGGEPVDCSSPYVIDTSTLSTGDHNISFTVIIDGEVRGLATETFTVLEEVFIEFQDVTYSVVEDDRIYNVTIVRQGEPGEDIVISVSPNADPTSFDSADFPSDYDQGAQQVTFVPGGPDEITFQLRVREDSIFENNETILLTFLLTPTAIDSGARIGVRNESRVTIINDDMVQVMFQQSFVETDESSGQARFSVIFAPQPTDIPYIFIVETFDFSPADAEAVVDYQPLRTDVILNPLQVTANLAVNIIQDSITERTEAFGVRIIMPKETQELGVTLGSPSVIPIRITDDDPGDLEITCFTNFTGDEHSGRTLTVFFDANQDATFRCRMTGRSFESCTSPHVFMNVDFSETVRVEIEGITTLLFIPKIATANKTVAPAIIRFDKDVSQPVSVENGALRVRIGTTAYIVDGYHVQIVCNATTSEGLPIIISWHRNGVLDETRGNASMITVTDANDGDVFTCMASNTLTDKRSDTVVIFVSSHAPFCISTYP